LKKLKAGFSGDPKPFSAKFGEPVPQPEKPMTRKILPD
jgi:hypothetical protein